MAVDRLRQTQPDSIFTYQPKIGENSIKIAQSLSDDFLTRQQKHIEKQRQLSEQTLPPAFTSKPKLAPIPKRKAVTSTNELFQSEVIYEDEKTETTERLPIMIKESDVESKVNQMISTSPYARDPIVKRRHQSKPDNQRTSVSKSIAAGDALPARRERSVSPPQLRPSRSRTMPSFTARNTGSRTARDSTGVSLERLQRAHEMVERAINERKIFCIAGSYYALREALRERGWVEKFCFANGGSGSVTSTVIAKENIRPVNTVRNNKDKARDSSDSSDDDVDDDDDFDDKNRVPPWEEDNGFYGIMSRMLKNHLPNFVFTTKTSTIDYKMLQKDQIVNHYSKNSCLTTKNGLCVNLRNLPWYEPVDPNVFFPRCYKISTDEEKQEFIDDFRITACQATVKWMLEKFDMLPTSKSRPSTASSLSNGGDCKEPENPPADASQPQLKEPAKPTKNKSACAPTIPSKMLDVAVEQCEKYLTEREHGFIDVMREPNVLSDAQWDEFLQWYYQLVHQRGRIASISQSLDKLRYLDSSLEAVHPQFRMDGSKNIWIVKPGAKSRGRGVQCYAKLDEIIKLVSSQVIREGKYVVQKYIERPLLIHDTKFDIRQWFVVTDWNPLTMWFFQDSYLRFCSQLFTLDRFDESVHLSNNSIQANYSNARGRSSKLPSDNMWTSQDFKDYLLNELGQPNVWDDVIYPGMRSACIYALEACQDIIVPRKNSFELFGADFMLTEDFQPWLIEVNCSPCLAPSTVITARMCPQVLEDLLKITVDRKIDKNCSVGRFELAYRQQMVSAPNYLGVSLAIEGQHCGRRVKPAVCQPSLSQALALGVTRSASVSSDSSDTSSDSDSSSGSSSEHRQKSRQTSRRQPIRQSKSLQSTTLNSNNNSTNNFRKPGEPPAVTRIKHRHKSEEPRSNPIPLAIATCKIDPTIFEPSEIGFSSQRRKKLYYVFENSKERRQQYPQSNARIAQVPSTASMQMPPSSVLLSVQRSTTKNIETRRQKESTKRRRKTSLKNSEILPRFNDQHLSFAEDDVISCRTGSGHALLPRMLLPLKSNSPKKHFARQNTSSLNSIHQRAGSSAKNTALLAVSSPVESSLSPASSLDFVLRPVQTAFQHQQEIHRIRNSFSNSTNNSNSNTARLAKGQVVREILPPSIAVDCYEEPIEAGIRSHKL